MYWTAYHRLVLLVGPVGAGKETVLRVAAERCDGRLINVNLELSRRLLDLTRSNGRSALPGSWTKFWAQTSRQHSCTASR